MSGCADRVWSLTDSGQALGAGNIFWLCNLWTESLSNKTKKNLESTFSQKVVSKFLQFLKFLGPRRDVCFAHGRFASAAPLLIVLCSLSLKTRQHVALATLSTMNGSHPKEDLVQKPAHANDSALFLMINTESRVEKYALHHHQQFWQFYVCLSVRSMFRTSPRISQDQAGSRNSPFELLFYTSVRYQRFYCSWLGLLCCLNWFKPKQQV